MANNIHPSHRSYFQSYLQSSYQAHPTTTFNIESYETTTNTNEGSLPNEMNADPESPSHSFSPSINSDAQQNSFEFQKNFTLYCSEKNRRTKKKKLEAGSAIKRFPAFSSNQSKPDRLSKFSRSCHFCLQRRIQ